MIENRIGQQNLHIHRQNVLHLSTICNLKKTYEFSYCPTQSHDQRIMSRHLKKDLQLHPENPRINCHDPVMQHTLSICVLQYVGFVYMEQPYRVLQFVKYSCIVGVFILLDPQTARSAGRIQGSNPQAAHKLSIGREANIANCTSRLRVRYTKSNSAAFGFSLRRSWYC